MPARPRVNYHRRRYTGPTAQVGNVTVGYGKLSAGVFGTVAADSGRSFGTHGQDGQSTNARGNIRTSNQLGVRLRTNSGTTKEDDRCDDSYVMVTMIPLQDQAGTDILTVNVTSERWRDEFEHPNLSRPDRMTNYELTEEDENYGSATGTTGFSRLI